MAHAHLAHTVAGRRVFKAVASQIKKIQKLGAASEREGVRGTLGPNDAELLSADLHVSGRSSLSELAPSEIVLLDSLTQLRGYLAPSFVAVLGCPLCGSPSLITSVQFSGGAPIVCSSKVCPGMFRIVDESRIVSLPLI